MRYVPTPTKTYVLFDKGEARAYNLPEWTREVIMNPFTETAENNTRKQEIVDYSHFVDQMSVNNPLIHDVYLGHALRVLLKAYAEDRDRREALHGPIGRIQMRMLARGKILSRQYAIPDAEPA